MVDWSSLPSDVVRRIADCLLVTNVVNWYMDFRAVCPTWRSATDDPANSSDHRFRPRHWIIIDEVFESDSRLMVNTASGRILRKDLPVLRKYYVVAVTTNGALFVLADREHPHPARVLNPFTGHMIRFTAAVPYNVEVFSAALSCGSSPNLRVIWDSDSGKPDRYRRLYTADPDNEGFTIYEEEDCSYLMQRLAVVGCIGKDGELLEPLAPLPVAVAERVIDVVSLPKCDFDFHKALLSAFETSQITEYDLFHPYDILESAGELFLVLQVQHHLKVFRVNTDRIVLEPVESIGSRAFFPGPCRYMSVDADKFPSIDANCIYYVKSTDSTLDIYKYDLEDKKEEWVAEAIASLNPSSFTLHAAIPPFTNVQLLSSYTNSIRRSQLTRCARKISGTPSGVNLEYAYKEADPGSCWCLNMIRVVDVQKYRHDGAEVALS